MARAAKAKALESSFAQLEAQTKAKVRRARHARAPSERGEATDSRFTLAQADLAAAQKLEAAAKASAPKPAIKTVSKTVGSGKSKTSAGYRSERVTGETSVRKNIAGEYDGTSVDKLQQKLLAK